MRITGTSGNGRRATALTGLALASLLALGGAAQASAAGSGSGSGSGTGSGTGTDSARPDGKHPADCKIVKRSHLKSGEAHDVQTPPGEAPDVVFKNAEPHDDVVLKHTKAQDVILKNAEAPALTLKGSEEPEVVFEPAEPVHMVAGKAGGASVPTGGADTQHARPALPALPGLPALPAHCKPPKHPGNLKHVKAKGKVTEVRKEKFRGHEVTVLTLDGPGPSWVVGPRTDAPEIEKGDRVTVEGVVLAKHDNRVLTHKVTVDH